MFVRRFLLNLTIRGTHKPPMSPLHGRRGGHWDLDLGSFLGFGSFSPFPIRSLAPQPKLLILSYSAIQHHHDYPRL
jgi:hypothetical protein